MPRPSRLPRVGVPAFRGAGWVALSDSGVVGAGLTADDARVSAKLSRTKELTQVTYFPTDSSQPLELPPIFDRARAALPDPSSAWLVGGSVRDALLRRPVRDLDFAVAGNGLSVARKLANTLGAAFFPLDEARGTGRVVVLDPVGYSAYSSPLRSPLRKPAPPYGAREAGRRKTPEPMTLPRT